MTSCQDFLEIDVPQHKIISETVFDDEQTAISAMTGIYNTLFTASFSGGWENSVTVLGGLSGNELEVIRSRDLNLIEFGKNEILAENSRNLSLWSSAYNIIYMTNSLLEGLNNSNNISEEVYRNLKGEAQFVRAFTYFYLVNFYGDVPLVLSTDYVKNSLISRSPKEEVNQQILVDLTEAVDLLDANYRNGNRTNVNKFAAVALLARLNLYLENWEEAARLSDQVISQTGMYNLVEDLDQVFLANSKEAIWQISPIGRGGPLTFTNEGGTFIFHPFIPSLTKVRLTPDLVDSFEENDLRFSHWIGFNDMTQSFYAFKYKDRSSMENLTEYSMVLRLVEQFLIRAEARAYMGDLEGSIADINIVRLRAGLDPISFPDSQLNTSKLLEQIRVEREKELFTEWGHHWLDLKRWNIAGDVLSEKEPLWSSTDVLYPIPEKELMLNPNLVQNPGY